MKILATLKNKKNLKQILEKADGIIIGSNTFATRLLNSFSISEINEIILETINLKKEAFLIVNQMFTDNDLDKFAKELEQIDTKNLTGIIIADIGTLVLLEKYNLSKKAVYNPETLHTNYIDFNFLSSENILGAYVAKEITYEDIKIIASNKKHKLFMVGHGHLNMFYSKRKLLDNYQELTKSDESFYGLQNLKIIEPKRSENPYPIYQDKAGTHVFRSKVMNSFLYLDKLLDIVDYFVIDSIFKDDVYTITILEHYKMKSITEDEIKILESKYNEKWDNGFLDNKTHYKR